MELTQNKHKRFDARDQTKFRETVALVERNCNESFDTTTQTKFRPSLGGCRRIFFL